MPDPQIPDLNTLIFQVSNALEKREEPPAEADLLNLIKAHASVLELTEGASYTLGQIEDAMRQLQTQFTTRMGWGLFSLLKTTARGSLPNREILIGIIGLGIGNTSGVRGFQST